MSTQLQVSIDDAERATALLVATAGDPNDVHYLVMQGDPASKSRPRFGKGGRVYTPAESRIAEARASARFRQWLPEPMSGNVAVACIFYRSNRQRIDVDNMLKHVCDAANTILWIDDSQVTSIVGVIELDPNHPRTLIAISPHDSTMTRGSDAHYPCAVCSKPIMMAGQTNVRKTCSRECSAAAKGFSLLTAPVICGQCGQPFKRTTTAQRLCSPQCRVESLRAKRRAARKPPLLCGECSAPLAHRRGGRCRDCWRRNPVAVAGERS